MVLKGYKFSQTLKQVILQSGLPINEVYWILKDNFGEIEKLYINQLEKELDEEEEISDDELDNE